MIKVDREKELTAKLKKCDTFPEMIQAIGEYYHIDMKLGLVSKGLIIYNLPKLLKKVGFKSKPKWPSAKEI